MGKYHTAQNLVLLFAPDLPPLLWVEEFLSRWELRSRVRPYLYTSLGIKFPFFQSLRIGYIERLRCGVECDGSAV